MGPFIIFIDKQDAFYIDSLACIVSKVRVISATGCSKLMKRRNKSDNPQTPLEVAQPLTPFEIIMSLIFDSSVGMNVPLLLIVVLGFFDLVQIHSRKLYQ
ncbi:unnamed protein product [Mucor hiemalis]